MQYLFIVFTGAALAATCTIGVRWIARKKGVLDLPSSDRKIHTAPIPLLGGIGVGVAFIAIILGYVCIYRGAITDTHVSIAHIIGIVVAVGVLCLSGALDDFYTLAPWQQFIGPVIAVLVVIFSGIGVSVVTNPFSTTALQIDVGTLRLGQIAGYTFTFSLWSDIISMIWLLGTIFTTKFLDGLDGLVSGMTVIGALIIGVLSLYFFVNTPTAILSFVVVGVFAGFLLFNFHPASIFLGESGSTIAGLLLGVLAILSGAKFATALLILGIPILDAFWVIARRIIIEKRSPFRADRKHIHFRLLDAGLSHRQAVLLLYAIAAVFGCAALFIQSAQKLIALSLLTLLMCSAGALLVRAEKNKSIESYNKRYN